jgi:hypothetical protein
MARGYRWWPVCRQRSRQIIQRRGGLGRANGLDRDKLNAGLSRQVDLSDVEMAVTAGLSTLGRSPGAGQPRMSGGDLWHLQRATLCLARS